MVDSGIGDSGTGASGTEDTTDIAALVTVDMVDTRVMATLARGFIVILPTGILECVMVGLHIIPATAMRHPTSARTDVDAPLTRPCHTAFRAIRIRLNPLFTRPRLIPRRRIRRLHTRHQRMRHPFTRRPRRSIRRPATPPPRRMEIQATITVRRPIRRLTRLRR